MVPFLALWTLLLVHGTGAASDHQLFLVSRISVDEDWCITVFDDSNVVLDKCDFHNSPLRQIWHRGHDGDFSSALYEPGEVCLGHVGDDPLVLTSCKYDQGNVSLSTTWGQEYWGDAPTRTDAVRLTNDGGLCAAAEHDTIVAGTTQIRMLPCQDGGRFAWHFHYDSCPHTASQLLRMCDGSGCIKAMNPGVPTDSNRVELVKHADSDAWLFDSWKHDTLCMGSGLMRLESNPSLCLQQGHNGQPRDGTWLRVYPCDCNNPYQQFKCGDPANTGSVTPSLTITTERQRALVLLRQDANDKELVFPLWPDYTSPDQLPLVLMSVRYGTQHFIDFNSPIMVADHRTNSFICLFQQGDGNFRILRSSSVTACHNNTGKLLFHTGFRRDYVSLDSARYFTLLQGDGNLITVAWWNRDWVWKSCSNGEAGRYSLVLNSDDSSSIVDVNGRAMWDSSTQNNGCLASEKAPIVLMSTNGLRELHSGDQVEIRERTDHSTLFYPICISQQGDGNVRVSYLGCSSSRHLLFHSGLSRPLTDDEYVTTLQRDGNLVTRTFSSGAWAWQTGSAAQESDGPRDQGWEGIYGI